MRSLENSGARRAGSILLRRLTGFGRGSDAEQLASGKARAIPRGSHETKSTEEFASIMEVVLERAYYMLTVVCASNGLQ